MNGPLAQFVALTCHANACLRGQPVPEFFPANSTCQFCESVKFVKVAKTLLGKAREKLVAANPNAWFDHLRREGILGVRLYCTPQNQPGISDRMSAAFVGGGGTWAMEALQKRGKSAVWLSRWEVWNRNAPESRIWRVSYGRVSDISTRPASNDDLVSMEKRLRSALTKIHRFSERHNCGGFTTSFARAIHTLDSGGAQRLGAHQDLIVDGVTSRMVTSLLDACQTAWVFGGMGSWNDMGFEGSDQAEYDRVSEHLFATLNETIQAAANASCSTKA